MYVLIDARQASGKTVQDYCAKHGISRSKHNYWQTRRKRETSQRPMPQSGFAELLPRGPQALSLRLSGGLKLTFDGDQLELAARLLLQMDRRGAEF